MPMRGAAVNLTREPSLSSQRRLERTRSSRLSGTIDLKKLRQSSGAFRAFHAANEHRLGTPFRPRHDVQHFVHPVAEVDVGAAARRVHHVRPRRAPLVRMAGRVLLAAVRLRLGDAPPHDGPILQPTAQPRADKRLGTCHRVNRIIFCSKPAHHFSCGQSLLHGSRVVIHIAVGPSSPPIIPMDSALFFTAQHPTIATSAAHPSTTISFFILQSFLLVLCVLCGSTALKLVIGIGNISTLATFPSNPRLPSSAHQLTDKFRTRLGLLDVLCFEFHFTSLFLFHLPTRTRDETRMFYQFCPLSRPLDTKRMCSSNSKKPSNSPSSLSIIMSHWPGL